MCTNCGAARAESTDPDTIIITPVNEPTELVRERTTVYDDEPVVMDNPVIIDDRQYWPWALAALLGALMIFLLFLALRDDPNDDTLDTTTGPVATAPTQPTVAPQPVIIPAPTTPPTAAAPATTVAPSSGPVAQTPSPQSGDGFELSDLQITDDGGRFAGSAQVRNTRDNSLSRHLHRPPVQGRRPRGHHAGHEQRHPGRRDGNRAAHVERPVRGRRRPLRVLRQRQLIDP